MLVLVPRVQNQRLNDSTIQSKCSLPLYLALNQSVVCTSTYFEGAMVMNLNVNVVASSSFAKSQVVIKFDVATSEKVEDNNLESKM
jgi:hypothetical protein